MKVAFIFNDSLHLFSTKVAFFNYTLTSCAILDKNCSKQLHVKIEKVAKSCNIKSLETAQNIELHIF